MKILGQKVIKFLRWFFWKIEETKRNSKINGPLICLELIIRSITEALILVPAPTAEVAMPAINNGAAAPAVVNVKIPPAIKEIFKGQLISKSLWRHRLDQKTNEIFSRISARPSL